MSSSGGTFYWNIRFIRPVQDWELESVASFMDHISISAVSLRRNEVDKMYWKLSPRGVFDVRSYYKALQPSITCPFPWKSLCKPQVLTKVRFYIWTAALQKILTVDSLRRRKLVVVDWCCMCKRNGETMDHLLLLRPIA